MVRVCRPFLFECLLLVLLFFQHGYFGFEVVPPFQWIPFQAPRLSRPCHVVYACRMQDSVVNVVLGFVVVDSLSLFVGLGLGLLYVRYCNKPNGGR